MLDQNFKEFIELLNSNRVKYMVVGGYALAFHGHPRYTKDIDIWVLVDPDNAKGILKSIHDFGFSELGLEESDFLQEGVVIQLGYPPSRIDLLTSASGVDFVDCFKDKQVVDIDGIPINFIDVTNLKRNKKATGRLQDLADIESLERH